MSDQLVLLDEARRALAKVASVDDAKKIRDQAAALEHYGRQQKLSLESVNKAGEIKVRAERRIGELLAKVPRETPQQQAKHGVKGGRGNKKPLGAERPRVSTPLVEALDRAGIAPTMAKDCQKLAAIPAPMFEAALVTMQTSDEVKHRGVSTDAMLRAYRESDGSTESIVSAVKKEVAASPEVRYGAAFARMLRAVAEVEEMAQEPRFARWLHSSGNNLVTLRAAIKGLRAIEKGTD